MNNTVQNSELIQLHNVELLEARPTAQVLICDSIQSARVAQKLVDAAKMRVVVTTWFGGGDGIALADWLPLSGREVVLLTGAAATERLTQTLSGIAAAIKAIDGPSDAADGWIANAPETFDLKAHAKANIRLVWSRPESAANDDVGNVERVVTSARVTPPTESPAAPLAEAVAPPSSVAPARAPAPNRRTDNGASADDIAQLMEPVARRLLGEPNEHLSKPNDLRFGTHGSMSIDVEHGRWHDHESKIGGGVLDLIIKREAASTRAEAMHWIEKQGLRRATAIEPQKPQSKPRIVRAYDYVSEDGEIVFQVCRYEPKTFRQRRPDPSARDGWNWSVKGVVQVPYKLPQMLAALDALVFVVEGEKDADALAAIGLVATCNAGGAGKWRDELLPHFAGRRVVILPDNDDAGRDHARLVASKLRSVAADVRVLELPALPAKGDVSDWLAAGGNADELVQMAIEAAIAPTEGPAADAVALVSRRAEDAVADPDGDAPPGADRHFFILGFDKSSGSIAVFHNGRQQILLRQKGDFRSDLGFAELAPLNWWEDFFQGSKKDGGINRAAAFQWLYDTATARGVFSNDRERGRGAWLDSDRVVFHAGTHLVVDGIKTELSKIAESKFVYTAGSRLAEIGTSATKEEGQSLLEVMKMVRWASPDSAQFLAGWCFLAPVCGVLSWRPHIWVTGGSGSGKSTLVDELMKTVAGDLGLMFDGGSSTEAGIRQQLDADARPVIVDEIEGSEPEELQRVNQILKLARTSSSANSAMSTKGTNAGKAVNYRVRAMFCMASVNLALVKETDVNRFAVLNLRPKGSNEGHPDYSLRFASALQAIKKDDKLPARLLARALGMMPIINESVYVFTAAVAKHRGDKRFGDQQGTLLAGSWCLTHDVAPTVEQAQAIVEGVAWDSAVAGRADSTPDEVRCLQQLLDAKITLHGEQISVRSLVKRAHGLTVEGLSIERDVAKHQLTERWINISRQGHVTYLAIRHASNGVNELLSKTRFGVDWAGHLSRIQGYKVLDKTSFGSAEKTGKAHGIPLAAFLADDPDGSPI